MKKTLSLLMAGMLLVLLATPIIALASDISGARYWAQIVVSNNSTATTNVATTANISTTSLITGNYLNSSANNTVMRNSSGADIPFQPGYTDANLWSMWVPGIGENSILGYILYTAESTGGEIRYFPDLGGMVTTDSATLELSDNFTIEQKGWIDTAYVSSIEEYTVSNSASTLGGTNWAAQSFTATENFTITAVELKIYRVGNPGVVSISIRDTDANLKPTGTDLTANTLNGNALTTSTAGEWNKIELTKYNLSANNEYAIVMRSAANNLGVRRTTPGGGYTDGRMTYSANSGASWTVDNTTDLVFKVIADKALVRKQGAFMTYISSTGNITSQILTTSANVTAGGLASGEYIVKTTADGTNLKIFIDGNEEASVALGAATVPDTSANWTNLLNNSMPYMEYHSIMIGGNFQQDIEWEYSDTFLDATGNNHDAAPLFRGSSSNPAVSANMTAFTPVAEAKAPAYVLELAPAFIDADALTGNVTGTFTTTPATSTGFPLAGVIIAVANATGTPEQLPLLIIAVFVILAASLSMSAVMRRYGSGSLIVKTITIVAFLGIFIALKNFGIDFWMLCVFLVIAVAMMMASRHAVWQ